MHYDLPVEARLFVCVLVRAQLQQLLQANIWWWLLAYVRSVTDTSLLCSFEA